MKAARRPFVVYWNNIPSPYMVERFNALSDLGTFEFEAWFNDRTQSDRGWLVDETTWRFSYRYLPVTRIGARNLHWPLPVIGRRPDVLISLYSEPVFLVGWMIARLRDTKTGFWAEITFDKWVRRYRSKELIKKWVFSKVGFIATAGADGRQFARRYGADENQIFFIPHAIDVQHFQQHHKESLTKRNKLRRKLGLTGTTFIYVGRLWWGKGINYLLDSFKTIQRQNTEQVSLLLVGEGPEEYQLRKQCEEQQIKDVCFAGFKHKHDLPIYYALADVFVFPTLGDPYGLVVDEAMACSLPIICTSAVGEIRDRVEEGVNGYLVPPGDIKALADQMEKLVFNRSLRKKMGKISAQKIIGHTPKRWAEDFERTIEKVMRMVD